MLVDVRATLSALGFERRVEAGSAVGRMATNISPYPAASGSSAS
jgi:hypothetical protein